MLCVDPSPDRNPEIGFCPGWAGWAGWARWASATHTRRRFAALGLVLASTVLACAQGVAPGEAETELGGSGWTSDMGTSATSTGVGDASGGSSSGASAGGSATWTGTAGPTGGGPGEAGDGVFFCGDGLIDLNGGEACDGLQLAGQSCASLGLVRGDLACAANCQFDISGCDPCGNDRVDGPTEECDGNDLGAISSCTELDGGSDLGTLRCTEACKYDRQLCKEIPTTVVCNDIEHEISEGGIASSIIEVAAPEGQVAQELVALRIEIDLEHGHLDELLIRLRPQGRDEVLLFEQQDGTQCSGNHMQVVLRDDASTRVATACRSSEQPAISGEHQPVEQLLPTLAEDGIAGTWYLVINDRKTPDTNAGVLKGWCMHYATRDLGG